MKQKVLSLVVAAALLPAAARALPPTLPGEQGVPSSVLPNQLKEVRFDQRIGESLPQDATFRDEAGRTVKLGQYFGKRPVVVAFVYFECPMLCTLVLNGLTASLRSLKLDPGKDFDVVAISFDPRDTSEKAAAKRAKYLESYGRPSADAGWHFLVGSEAEIRRVTDAAGFHYAFDAAQGQYAHASGIIVATPDGRLSRYFYGVEYPPRDLRLGIVDAGEGKTGSVIDRALLYCFHYDPSTGRYSTSVLKLLRLGAAATALALVGYVFAWGRRPRTRDEAEI